MHCNPVCICKHVSNLLKTYSNSVKIQCVHWWFSLAWIEFYGWWSETGLFVQCIIKLLEGESRYQAHCTLPKYAKLLVQLGPSMIFLWSKWITTNQKWTLTPLGYNHEKCFKIVPHCTVFRFCSKINTTYQGPLWARSILTLWQKLSPQSPPEVGITILHCNP